YSKGDGRAIAHYIPALRPHHGFHSGHLAGAAPAKSSGLLRRSTACPAGVLRRGDSCGENDPILYDCLSGTSIWAENFPVPSLTLGSGRRGRRWSGDRGERGLTAISAARNSDGRARVRAKMVAIPCGGMRHVVLKRSAWLLLARPRSAHNKRERREAG